MWQSTTATYHVMHETIKFDSFCHDSFMRTVTKVRKFTSIIRQLNYSKNCNFPNVFPVTKHSLALKLSFAKTRIQEIRERGGSHCHYHRLTGWVSFVFVITVNFHYHPRQCVSGIAMCGETCTEN